MTEKSKNNAFDGRVMTTEQIDELREQIDIYKTISHQLCLYNSGSGRCIYKECSEMPDRQKIEEYIGQSIIKSKPSI